MDVSLTKLGTALALVFAVSLVALLAELLYLLWRRRRRFHHQNQSDVDPDQISMHSKKLFFFLCSENQSRIEPHEPPPPFTHTAEADEQLKWQALYGSSRVLFTISEEDERDEGLESDKCSSAEKEIKEKKNQSVINVDERKADDQEMNVIIAVEDEATPFETPCASPVYFTPSPSPTREAF